MGVVTGADVPMFLGAMIMGPLGGWSMHKIDAIWDGKIKPGFEMLVNNFSAGIWGMILAIVGFFVLGPFVEQFSNGAGDGVDFLVDNHLLPLASIFVEPAKVLFLNNAHQPRRLHPAGHQRGGRDGQVDPVPDRGQPRPRPRPAARLHVFGKGIAKASAPGAAIIQFFGGIHEIYFPYVLMKPKLIVAMIVGGMTGVLINVVFSTGLRAPAAPGSIIAVYLAAPTTQPARGDLVGHRRRPRRRSWWRRSCSRPTRPRRPRTSWRRPPARWSR